jgi:hypothetical protein
VSASTSSGGGAGGPLATALAEAERLARGRGLSARVVDHWVPHVEVTRQEGQLLKRITIIPAASEGLAVEATVIQLGRHGTMPAPDAMWWSTVVGRTLGRGPAAAADLGRLLETAWERLSSFGVAELERHHRSVLRHVTERIDPILEGFAASVQGSLSKEGWRLRSLTWPRRHPARRLTIQLSPRDGILLECQIAQRAGLLRLRHWVNCPGFPERRVRDWSDTAALSSALKEASAAVQ